MDETKIKSSLQKKFFDLHHQDARKLLDFLYTFQCDFPMIDTTITSPPYFDAKLYDVQSELGHGQIYIDFLNDLAKIFKDIFKKTKDTGSLWVIVDDIRREKQPLLFPFTLITIIKSQGWVHKDVIIWKKDKALPYYNKGNMRNIKEYILFFVKTKKFKFHADRIRETDPTKFKEWWIKYPERYNPKGNMPTNIWEFSIPTQGSWGNNDIKHFNPLPWKLVERIMLLTTNEQDIVFDPFAGTGTVLSVANYLHRNSFGFELNRNYIKMYNEKTKTNISNIMAQEYKLRADFESVQSKITERIVRLRIQKYPKVLRTRLYKTLSSDIFKALNSHLLIADYNLQGYLSSEEENKKLSDYIEVDIYFIFSKPFSENLTQNIFEITTKPPLSKYEIIPKIVTISNDKFWSIASSLNLPEKLWIYRSEIAYHYDKEITLKQWKENSFNENWFKTLGYNDPPILSNLQLKETIVHSWKSAFEKHKEKLNKLREISLETITI